MLGLLVNYQALHAECKRHCHSSSSLVTVLQTDLGHAVNLDALRVKANALAATPPAGAKLKKDKKDKKQKKEKKDRGSKVTSLLLLVHMLVQANRVISAATAFSTG